jgi:translation initiation factor 2A
MLAQIYGYMPAKGTVFDERCRPEHELGSGPWNTVAWSPLSSFFAIGGFGNLPGDMEFFDRKADGKCKSMGKAKHHCVVSIVYVRQR